MDLHLFQLVCLAEESQGLPASAAPEVQIGRIICPADRERRRLGIPHCVHSHNNRSGF